MNPPEGNLKVLVSFPHLCVEKGEEVPTLEINKMANVARGEPVVQILQGEKLIEASKNNHVPIEYKVGESRFCLMSRIYDFPPEELAKCVEHPNRGMYLGPKEIYRALGDMLMGDDEGSKSQL